MAVRYVNFMLVKGAGGHPKAPHKKYQGDAGWDLFVSRETIINPGETADIHTDIKVNMPPFVFARIVGRSSTMRKHHLMVTEAIIDNDYTGEMFISIHNLSSVPFHVKQGMRLAQVIFHRIEDIRWSEVEEQDFQEGKRGSLGFGSTGLYDIE